VGKLAKEGSEVPSESGLRPASSQQIGPYRLLVPLPRPGVCEVWQAIHEKTGDPVALHLLPELRLAQREQLRSSFYARRSFTHGNVARLREEGFLEEHPWYTTDLHEGLSLAYLLERAPAPLPSPPASSEFDTMPSVQAPPPSLRAPSLVRVKRLLTGERLQLKLGVGYEVCLALEALHREGLRYGILGAEEVLLRDIDGAPVLVDPGLWEPLAREILGQDRLPPEVLAGGAVGARADVYAVGRLLYELLAGVPLSEAMENGELLPLWSLVELPRPLGRLIHKMLSPDPEERPGSPSDCAQALSAHLDRSRSLERPRFSSVLERAAGRPAQVAEVEALLFQGRGQGVFLRIEPGADVTALLEILGAQVALWGGRVHHARRAPWAVPLGAFEAALGPLQGPSFPDSDAPPWDDPAILPSVARTALLDAAEAALGEGPCLFIIEDVEHLDALSRALLLRLLRSGRRYQFVLTSAHPWALPAEELPQILIRQHTPLELAALLRSALGVSRLPAGLLDSLMAQDQRTPWLLEQQLASLVDRGLLTRDQIGVWRIQLANGRDELSPTDLLPTDRLLRERMGRLSPLCSRLLAAAILLWGSASRSWLLHVAALEDEEPAALEALEQLQRRRWLHRGAPGEVGLVAFLDEIPEGALVERGVLREMHLRAAELWRGLPGVWSRSRAAFHFRQAGELAASATLHEEVGVLAWRMGAPQEAAAHWERACSLTRSLPGNPGLPCLLRRHGLALAALGEPRSALRLLLEALDASPSRASSSRSILSRGAKAHPEGEMLRERILVQTQLALLPALSPAERLRAALSALQLAEKLPVPPRSLPLVGGVIEGLVERSPLGSLSPAMLLQARRRLSPRATLPQETFRWLHQGVYFMTHARWPQGEQALRRAASRAQQLRAQGLWLEAMSYLTFGLLHQGELGQCEELADTFGQRAPDEPETLWAARCVRAVVALHRGRPALVLEQLGGTIPPPTCLEVRVSGLRALALLREGREAEALKEAERASQGMPSVLEAEALLGAAQAVVEAKHRRGPLLHSLLATLRRLAEEAPVLGPRRKLIELTSGQGRHRVELIVEEARKMELPYAMAIALRVWGSQGRDQQAEDALKEAEEILRRLRG
jgi:tetratricopeptide (TPR) repeat protein